MIPAICPDGAAPGEQALFRALAVAPETDDWIVLHSLWLAEHVRQVEGEADFVVIVPGTGILVIEIKSHQRMEILSDGRWKLGNDAPTTRDPFNRPARRSTASRTTYGRRRSSCAPPRCCPARGSLTSEPAPCCRRHRSGTTGKCSTPKT